MALGAVAARAGHRSLIWTRRNDVAERINGARSHASVPEQVPLEAGICATTEPRDFTSLDAVIYAAPAQALRASLHLFAPFIRRRHAGAHRRQGTGARYRPSPDRHSARNLSRRAPLRTLRTKLRA